MSISRVVQSVAFEADGGLQVSFYDPDTDVTTSGLVQMHTLLVPHGNEYDDELTAVAEAIQYLISDVMQDFPALPKRGDPE